MKRGIKLLLLIAVLGILIPMNVFAAGSVSVSTSSLSMNPGGSGSFTITANNAVGRVDISSSNPGVATVSSSSEWLENSSATIYVSGKSAGSATITVRLTDMATFDGQELHNTYYVNVSVVNPAPVTPPSTPKPSNPSTPSNPATADTRSTNNNLKSLKVDGFELTKIGDTTYTLSVKNSVDHITVKAEKEDNKATVKGDGNQTLKVGDNKIDIVVTAENGATKTYTITVTRRDTTFSLDQIKDAIGDSEDGNVEITLGKDLVLSEDTLKQMKESDKTFHFNQFDDEKNLLYSWTIVGKNMSSTNSFDLSVSFEAKDREKLRSTMEYAEGIYFKLKNQDFAKDTKFKFYLGDQYKDKTELHLYQYSKDNKKFVQTIKVIDGYVELSLDQGGEYFLTQATYDSIVAEEKFNIFIPICIAEALIILILLITRKGKHKKEKEKVVEKDTSQTTTIPPTTPVEVSPVAAPDFKVYPESNDDVI